MSLEVRIAHLEGAYEQINHRLGTVEQRLLGVENKLDDFRTQADQKFLWVIGLIVVSILIPFAERFVTR